MEIVDQAFILKVTKYQETSIITSLLSSHHGVLHTISKGVRSQRKGVSANIYEVGNLVDIELRSNPLRNLQHLQKIRFRDNISQGLYAPLRQSMILYLMELTEKSTIEGPDTDTVFSLLYSFFLEVKKISKKELHTIPLLYTLHLYQELGYPTEQWLEKHALSEGDLHAQILPARGRLLDDFLRFVDAHFQPLRTPKSLAIIREFHAAI